MGRTKMEARKGFGSRYSPDRPRWSAAERLALAKVDRQTILRSERDMRSRFKDLQHKPKKVLGFVIKPPVLLAQPVDATFQGMVRTCMDLVMQFLPIGDPSVPVGPSGLCSIVRLNTFFRDYVRFWMKPLEANPFCSPRERLPLPMPSYATLHASALARHLGGLYPISVHNLSEHDMAGFGSALTERQPIIYRYAGLRNLRLRLTVRNVAELKFKLPPFLTELLLECVDVSGQVHGLLEAAAKLTKLVTLRLYFAFKAQIDQLNLAQFAKCEELKSIIITSDEGDAQGIVNLSDAQVQVLRGMDRLTTLPCYPLKNPLLMRRLLEAATAPTGWTSIFEDPGYRHEDKVPSVLLDTLVAMPLLTKLNAEIAVPDDLTPLRRFALNVETLRLEVFKDAFYHEVLEPAWTQPPLSLVSAAVGLQLGFLSKVTDLSLCRIPVTSSELAKALQSMPIRTLIIERDPVLKDLEFLRSTRELVELTLLSCTMTAYVFAGEPLAKLTTVRILTCHHTEGSRQLELLLLQNTPALTELTVDMPDFWLTSLEFFASMPQLRILSLQCQMPKLKSKVIVQLLASSFQHLTSLDLCDMELWPSASDLVSWLRLKVRRKPYGALCTNDLIPTLRRFVCEFKDVVVAAAPVDFDSLRKGSQKKGESDSEEEEEEEEGSESDDEQEQAPQPQAPQPQAPQPQAPQPQAPQPQDGEEGPSKKKHKGQGEGPQSAKPETMDVD